MGIWGVIILLAGALLVGVALQAILRAENSYAWLYTAIGAFLGGFVASEYLGAASTWGWEVTGMFVFPALIGAVVTGGIVELVTRSVSGTQRPAPHS